MQRLQGKVEEVSILPLKVEVVTTSLAGSTNVLVDSIADLDEYGGRLRVEDTDTIIVYSEIDEDSNSISLPVALVEDLLEDTELYQEPYAEERVATVRIDDAEDSVTCRVAYAIQGAFDDGVRELEEQETVLVEMDEDGEFTIVEKVTQPYYISGASIPDLPDYVPEPVVGPTAPPSQSPDVTSVAPMNRALLLTVPAQTPYEGYFVEVARDTGFAVVEQTATSRSNIITVSPLPANVDLWVRVTLFNDLGSAPAGLAVGPFRTLQLEAVDVKDLVLTANKFKISSHAIY